jgi:predicted RNase H-like HicB family nuclease
MTSNYPHTQTQIPRIGDIVSQGSTVDDTQSFILDRLETLTNQTGQLKTEVQERPLKYNLQIRDLGNSDYELLEPLLITIEEYPGDDVIIASFPEIEAFGEGVTETEAILNLKWAILDLYDELVELSNDELGDLPKSWLTVLQKVINTN